MSNNITTCNELYNGKCDGENVIGMFVVDSEERGLRGEELEDWDGNVIEIDNDGIITNVRIWGCGL